MESFIAQIIDFQIKVIAFHIDKKACESKCTKIEGHLPYTFEVKGQFKLNSNLVKDVRIDPR